MTIPLIGIAIVLAVLGAAVAVAVTRRSKPDVDQAPVEYSPVNELSETRPVWTDDNIRAFADTVPNIRAFRMAEKAAEAIADIPLPEVPQPEGDPEQ